MKLYDNYGETITSGEMKTGKASIELTPEMFSLLSSGMYTDKILAAIRETTCNARDAQVEAGSDVPLEMHLPTQLEPFYHIRDYGSGLTERQVLGYTEMVNGFDPVTGESCQVEKHEPGLYLRYGKSTKRDSNLQIGGFGIGCKAPLAYSDSFIVESYQGGTVKTYSIYKEGGIPNIAKLGEMLTKEKDGLKVKIAVAASDISTFASKTRVFLMFFGYPVTITGNAISYKVDYALQTELFDTTTGGQGYGGNVYASMGGVVYRVSSKHSEGLGRVAKGNTLIMKFNIGELAVAGSREALSEDEDTVAKLKQRVTQIKSDFYAVIQKEVEDSKYSIHQAYQLLLGYRLLTGVYNKEGPRLMGGLKLTIGGLDADAMLSKYKATTFRRYKGDSCVDLLSFSNAPVILEVDRGTGFLKVARRRLECAGDYEEIIFAFDDNDVRLLKEFFGSDLEILKVSELYEEYFPRVAPSTTIKVAASGLFTPDKSEIQEIAETQEGYYIPLCHDDCVMQGVPGSHASLSTVDRVVWALIKAGQLTQGEVFYTRRGGIRAVKKTQLKELTWPTIIAMAKKCYTEQDYKDSITLESGRAGNPMLNVSSLLVPLWDAVKGNYPTWANLSKDTPPTDGLTFLDRSGLLPLLEATYIDDSLSEEEKYVKEEEQIMLDFPLLTIPYLSRHLTSNMVNDWIAFYKWKMKGLAAIETVPETVYGVTQKVVRCA